MSWAATISDGKPAAARPAPVLATPLPGLPGLPAPGPEVAGRGGGDGWGVSYSLCEGTTPGWKYLELRPTSENETSSRTQPHKKCVTLFPMIQVCYFVVDVFVDSARFCHLRSKEEGEVAYFLTRETQTDRYFERHFFRIRNRAGLSESSSLYPACSAYMRIPVSHGTLHPALFRAWQIK